MYSGTTLRDKSGHTLGAHQRIDRLARRTLRSRGIDKIHFPTIAEILHFEGNHGPDGIKRKSPGHDEPWHEINPEDPNDKALINTIRDHRKNLTESLRADNRERAAFEAAWLAHAITDGLTPAHQYPLSAKIEELWGKPHGERNSVLDKIMIHGTTRRDTLSRNWQYWGSKGIFATHILFEWGVATSISAYKFPRIDIEESRLETCKSADFEMAFLDAVHEVYEMNLYEEFWRRGWTTRLARITRNQLIPLIVEIVALAWDEAYREAYS